MLLNRGVGAWEFMNCAVEIYEGRVAIGFGVIENALHTCIFTESVLGVFVFVIWKYRRLPVRKCAFNRKGVDFKFCSKNTGFICLPS